MKRILTTMCALTLLLAASVPALAAEPEQSASYYPTSVEEYMEGDSPRIKKVYQLSLADDPSQIPTEDFERDGRLYYLLDMTRKDEVGVDIQTITQTKTLASETNNMEKILQSLEPQMEVTTEDGYTGTLTLDHTTVKVAADGYAKITYRVNGGEYRTLADNLSTSKNYTLAASATALGLASNERVTEVMFIFGQAPAGFAQVEKPYLHCTAVANLASTSFVNVADVGGVYNGQWVQAVSRWVTTVYGKPVIPTLPRTGY